MTIFINPWVSAHGLNIERSAGAKLYFYDTGTTTPKTVYSDINESIAYTQPVVADSRGVFPLIYFSGLARVVMCDRDGTPASPIRTADPIYNKIGTVTIVGNFNSSTNAGNYPSTGDKGDMWRVVESFRLNSVSGSHVLNAGDSIVCNKSGATGVDADWDIVRGKATTDGVKTLSYAATINTDCANASTFLVTLTGNATLANPSNMIVGKTYCWIVRQDAIGGRSLSLAAYFKVSGAFGLRDQPNAITVLYGTVKTGSEIALSVAGINSPPGVVTLTPGAIVATDCSKGNVFFLDATGYAGVPTLSNPINVVPGVMYVWILKTVGGLYFNFGSKFKIMGVSYVDPLPKGSLTPYTLYFSGVGSLSGDIYGSFIRQEPRVTDYTVVNTSGTRTLDLSYSLFKNDILNGNASLNVTNLTSGTVFRYLARQDSTGGRDLTVATANCLQVGQGRVDPRPNAYTMITGAVFGLPKSIVYTVNGIPPAIEYVGSAPGGGGDFIVTCSTMGSNISVNAKLTVFERETKSGGTSWWISGHVNIKHNTITTKFNLIKFQISGLSGKPFLAEGETFPIGGAHTKTPMDYAYGTTWGEFEVKLRGSSTENEFKCILNQPTSKPTWAY